MENVLKYFQFSDFKIDQSNTFSGNEIAYSEINPTHYLIFEKKNKMYTLYVSKYLNRKEIAVKPPEILELLVENYDKSIPEHRIAIRQYLG
ncbi:hypothetical protein [uncultured Polaribacter sp.]|uniref:hypothetical protein n=1 Tax=uncultured Polaribacter sp. TaxID=174711 RepID=UPI002622C566|nr:hypothetical protein [uncultured Polaribacter sp.]